MECATSSDSRLDFTVQAQTAESSARACTFTTLHNTVETPVFMPVATRAALRSLDTRQVAELGFPVLLANTYHLLIRPGTEVFEKFGGIHNFMQWNKSILTDSGGFQIFSLSKDVKINEDGAVFKSYYDGKTISLSPETSIAVQRSIGSDIMMALDQCVASTSDKMHSEKAADITARWAARSLDARGDSPQSIFGIVQGACFADLRKRSALQITSLPFDGFAIGGLAVGENADERNDMTELTASLLPHEYPRYLMGVGTPIDLLEAVHRGVDMFDCILPAAFAQQGVAFTSHGKVELRRGVYTFDTKPIDENCSCPACAQYSKAYLHHLIKTGEYYGAALVGIHNLTFYRNLMQTMRMHILGGTFASYYRAQKDILALDDNEHPPRPTPKKKRPLHNTLGDYEVITRPEGFRSIRHISSGEVMHSVTDPATESRTLYLNQSGLEQKISPHSAAHFVLWDVGLGAATNAMTTMLQFEKWCSQIPNQCSLEIISFENDLDSLKLSVQNASLFPHLQHAAPSALLKNGYWQSEMYPITWRLVQGNFPDTMRNTPQPDCIYYDMYSPAKNDDLWSYKIFSKIFLHCAGHPSRLCTYTNSTMARSALLAAGFYVGTGPSAGPKADTTIAATYSPQPDEKITLLDHNWLARFERSTAKAHASCSDNEKAEIELKVRSHPQFA